MRMRMPIMLVAAMLTTVALPARAWFHAGDEGGHWHASYAGPGGFAHAGGTAGYGWHGSAGGWGGGYHGYGYHGYGYHQPVTVNHYYGGGCYGCGGWGGAAVAGAVGLAAGAAVGAAAASANSANAYAAGVAAGAAYAIGTTYAALPAGCAYSPVGGASYYNCGGYWFQPAYGSNGVYYQVVPTP